MGVDGISILFVLSDRLPDAAVHRRKSWKSITNRVVEYMVAFLMLEGMVLGVFCALDLIVLFYLLLRVSACCRCS